MRRDPAGPELIAGVLGHETRSGAANEQPDRARSDLAEARLFEIEGGWPDPAPAPVLAATEWQSNAEMILDCVRLGYLQARWETLDATYGAGVWWQKWRPAVLHTPRREEGWDFTKMWFGDAAMDAVAFDPPYIATRSTRSKSFNALRDAYGLNDAPDKPGDVQNLINDGLTECYRVVKPGGIVLTKCQDYVWHNDVMWLGTHLTLTHALALGFRMQDRLEHLTVPRSQPCNVQRHARRNNSTLFVFRKAANV